MEHEERNNKLLEIVNKVTSVERKRKQIGTLSEKTVHVVLKHYLESDEGKHEIKIGSMYADIFTENEIIEIQTRGFDKLRKKLAIFLELYPVTVVYPIPHIKNLIWIDAETGELSKSRKSPIKGNAFFIFEELYKIKMFLYHPNLKFKIILMDVDEYRLLNGYSKDRKKGSERFDRIPTKLVDEIDITRKEDFITLIPPEIEGEFTAKDFAKSVYIKYRQAQVCLNVLYDLGLVQRVGKLGKAYLYKIEE